MKDFKIVKSRAIRKHNHARNFNLEKDEQEARDFLEWFNRNNGGAAFAGKVFTKALALSHSQVCKSPIKMFVVDNEMVGRKASDKNGVRTRDNFFFPKQIILDAEILEMQPTILKGFKKRFLKKEYKEKDLSLLEKGEKIFNKDKYFDTKKKNVAIENLYEIQDGCMSFPSEKEKVVVRANIIKVRYKTLGLTGLKTHEEWISGMKSHIFQHEIDHQKGIDIHMKKNDRKMKFVKEETELQKKYPEKLHGKEKE